MLTEYHGRPVAGGTFPAQIWKSFTESALAAMKARPETFSPPPFLSAVTRRVTYRQGQTELDNGLCRSTALVVYFAGRGPARTADCKRNEVDVPNVVGWKLANARLRLQAQPLTARLIYKPAAAGQRIGVVLRQFPKKGTLSSFGKVTLVLAKPLHGLVPRLVGLELRTARAKLAQLQLVALVRGSTGRVIAQRPAAGVAAAPGMSVTVVVAGG